MSAASLDPLEVPLDAVSLIEANAGTGKTWTITALYLRLLLETSRGVDSILVVTFTEIATAELRDRIRARLAAARAAFERGSSKADDADLERLLERVSDRRKAVLQLTIALREFDQAPIYTIHGFCQRVLGDRAFESAMPFQTEIVPDESLILQQICDDFWRRTLYAAAPLFARYVLDHHLEPGVLREELNGRIAKPYLEIRKPAAERDPKALEAAYERAYGAARALWWESREAIGRELLGNRNLHGGKYRSASVARWLDQMAACLACERPGIVLFERFDKFTPAVLAEATKNGAAPPRHPFFEACETLKQAHTVLESAYARRLSLLRAELLEYANAELVARKRRLRLQSYDDLLLDLDAALHAERGTQLAAALRERYSAALIDEFQDTDPVQYNIFRAIYGDSGLPVFLVGDPKQSIYSFRGADIFAYLEARHDARHHHTLDINWRSQPPLLQAVNVLFGGSGATFVIPDVRFVPSWPAPGDRGRFETDGEAAAPFEFWLVGGTNGSPLRKEDATTLAAEATAAEIARLLKLGTAGKARIVATADNGVRARPLAGGDVAALVRRHQQARAVGDALRRFGIASVERGSDSVFGTPEAEELQRVLVAIAEPGRETRLRAALATAMLGCSGTALHTLAGDEAQWEALAERFRAAHQEWSERGFIHMARRLFTDFRVLKRLLACADGERRVTNLLHLVELMHCATATYGIGAALEWLADKRRAPSGKNEEELLRLESDENLVKILTVHAAKGLEFPLVFCPFAWDGGGRVSKQPAIRFHDPDHDYAAVLDLGSDRSEQCRPLAEREALAEDVRLLYVALTRARYRCWMVWGNIRDAHAAAPAWLWHRRDDVEPVAGPLDDRRIRDDLERIVASAGGTIQMRLMPHAEAATGSPASAASAALTHRTLPRTLRDTRHVTSFSALAHAHPAETPDYDAAARTLQSESAAAPRDIHAFPRGARTGRCLHAIFEAIDFYSLERSELQRIVARELAAYGFAAHWVGVVADMVERVIQTPLEADGSLQLSRVSRQRRLNEIEFYYPIADLSHTGLRAILLDSGFAPEIRERIETLEFAPARGYMKGYIDLVFESGGRYYLADYKSNWLGPTLADYGAAEVCRAMARESYYLQYLIYSVALHRYLDARVTGYDYERHFGGVRYLFLRGMTPAQGTGSGVYADRPAAGLIDALDRYLVQVTHE